MTARCAQFFFPENKDLSYIAVEESAATSGLHTGHIEIEVKPLHAIDIRTLREKLRKVDGVDGVQWPDEEPLFLSIDPKRDAFEVARGVLQMLEEQSYISHEEHLESHKQLGLTDLPVRGNANDRTV